MEVTATHKSIRRGSSLNDHRTLLRSVFQSARERVVIVSPFISKSALYADGVPGLVKVAILRGNTPVSINATTSLHCLRDKKLMSAKQFSPLGK